MPPPLPSPANFNLLHEIGKEGNYLLLYPPPQAGLAILPNTLTGENPLKVTPKLLLAFEKIMVEYYAFCDMDTSIISNRLTNIFQLDESKANKGNPKTLAGL